MAISHEMSRKRAEVVEPLGNLRKRLEAEIERRKNQPRTRVTGVDSTGRKITITHGRTERIRLDDLVDEGEHEDYADMDWA